MGGSVGSNTIKGNNLEAGFTLMHFVNIMLLALESGDNETFNKVNATWKHNNIDSYLKKTNIMTHPYEIIFWKLGKIAYLTGSQTAGEEKLNIALRICNQTKDNQSLKAIGLGILSDKAFLISSSDSVKQNNLTSTIFTLCSEYEALMSMDLPVSMKEHFGIWEEDIIRFKDRKAQANYKILKYLSEQIYY